MYIDHHLMEDVEFFLKISEFFGEILSMIRYYPYPNMVYKIVLNKWISEDGKSVENEKTCPPLLKGNTALAKGIFSPMDFSHSFEMTFFVTTYKSLWPHDAVKITKGHWISSTFLSNKIEKICPWIWFTSNNGLW